LRQFVALLRVEVAVAVRDDGKAKRLGLSLAAYLRRTLERERVESQAPVSLDGLEWFAALAADLDDPAVMSEAW